MSQKYLLWLFLVGVVYFPLFLHLDTTTLSVFDEARRGCNAVEMAQNGNVLVTHFEGEPDMWGTKPPLLIWLQAGLMKVIGYNELAVRLPSALAGLALLFYLFWFSSNVLKRTAVGVFSVLVLVTTNGFISDHVTRTGDFDALLCLWLMLYLLTFYRYVHETDPQKKKQYIFLTALFVFLAVLTKGVAGFFFLPGLFLFALFSKQVLPLLANKYFWIATGMAVLGIMSFYLLREQYNPGYLEAVWNNEVGGRYQNALEGNQKSAWFYIRKIVEKNYSTWFFTLPFGLVASYFGTAKERSLSLLLLINSIVFLFIISNAQTKHIWYSAPVYASLALLSGFGIAAVFQLGYQKILLQSKWKYWLYLVSFVLLFFGVAYYQIVTKVYQPELAWHPGNDYSRYIRAHKDAEHYLVGKEGYNAHTLFYVKARQAEGKQISTFIPSEQQPKGTQYLICGPDDRVSFPKLHKTKSIEIWRDCELVEIESYK